MSTILQPKLERIIMIESIHSITSSMAIELMSGANSVQCDVILSDVTLSE